MCCGLVSYEQAAPTSKDDQSAKLQLCSRYLETFTQVKEKEKDFAEVSIELLAGMREMLQMDQTVFFCSSCFLLLSPFISTSCSMPCCLLLFTMFCHY